MQIEILKSKIHRAGVTAALLTANGIRVFSEAEIDAADAWLAGCGSP